jgi:hypothetical protein
VVAIHRFEILVDPLVPVVGYLVEGHGGSQDAKRVKTEGDE